VDEFVRISRICLPDDLLPVAFNGMFAEKEFFGDIAGAQSVTQ
jgi:hypothetical protein